jgi:hypothetical protein
VASRRLTAALTSSTGRRAGRALRVGLGTRAVREAEEPSGGCFQRKGEENELGDE